MSNDMSIGDSLQINGHDPLPYFQGVEMKDLSKDSKNRREMHGRNDKRMDDCATRLENNCCSAIENEHSRNHSSICIEPAYHENSNGNDNEQSGFNKNSNCDKGRSPKHFVEDNHTATQPWLANDGDAWSNGNVHPINYNEHITSPARNNTFEDHTYTLYPLAHVDDDNASILKLSPWLNQNNGDNNRTHSLTPFLRDHTPFSLYQRSQVFESLNPSKIDLSTDHNSSTHRFDNENWNHSNASIDLNQRLGGNVIYFCLSEFV
ncbi:hypothetical protein RFI_01550 [Reticulomyxa filosa]|uniref:Uncharacterized protein n=1 Tax=Reticulomyxa filosa TaxID=46433 RepID=X6PBF2_RETFI|nr:hypothetical protein RFI_01550 [Reticulomyxa filosa]|eukprot:ETO35506.1 hypothetical protein RFI_01550 [Reticulomyxa filosa]